MSSDSAHARPRQVTVAGWAVAVSSAIVVLVVFQTMGSLNGLEMRDQLTRSLTTGAGKDLGLTVEQAIDLIRWSLYVVGVAAAAAAILGIYVLQRDRIARIGVTVAAVPIVLTAPFAGSLPAVLVGVGAAMLWTRPARDWFAGRPVRRTEPLVERRPQPPVDMSVPPSRLPFKPPVGPPVDGPGGPSPATPRPTQQWGAPAPVLDFPPPDQPPSPAAPGWTPPGAAARPPQLRIAFLLTWIFSGVTGAGALFALLAMAVSKDAFVELIRDNPAWDSSMDEDLIVPAAVTVAGLVLVLCALAAVSAAYAWQRRRWAWSMLIGTICVGLVVGVLAFPASLLNLVAMVVALRLLIGVPSRIWIAGDDRPPPPPRRPW